MFKKTAILIGFSILTVGAIERPAYAETGARKAARLISHDCTPAQRNLLNLGTRVQFMTADIDQHSNGPASDAAINALLNLVEGIERALPEICR